MKKIVKTLLIFFLIFYAASPANAQIIRKTTFDKRAQCLDVGGVWRKFGNGCADSCKSQFSDFNFCSMAISYGCDCGDKSCYYDGKCISHQEYEQINSKKMKIREIEAQEGDEIREGQRKQLVNDVIIKLIERYNIPVDNQQQQAANSNQQNSNSSRSNKNEISANSNVASFYGAKNRLLGNNQSEKIYYNKKPTIQDVRFSAMAPLQPKSSALLQDYDDSSKGLVGVADNAVKNNNASLKNSRKATSSNNSAIPALFMQKILSNSRQKSLNDKSNTENSIKKPNDAIYDSENQGKIEDLENESKKRIQIFPVKSPQN